MHAMMFSLYNNCAVFFKVIMTNNGVSHKGNSINHSLLTKCIRSYIQSCVCSLSSLPDRA